MGIGGGYERAGTNVPRIVQRDITGLFPEITSMFTAI